MLDGVELLQRGIESVIQGLIGAFPVVILEGGRAVGKSTLSRALIGKNGWNDLVDLSDPGVEASLRLDPLRFLRDLPAPVFIDEAQLVPDLPMWIKRIVDERNGISGQFVLTGSARLGRTQLGGSDPLAGRAVRRRMYSLTESERANRPRPLASDLFDETYWSEVANKQTRAATWDVREHLRGNLPGIPGVLRPGDSNSWNLAMSAYVDSVIPLGAASERTDHSRLLRVFRYLVANPAQQLNLARMSSELQFRSETAANYLDALEASFLVMRVEAHRPTEHKVLTAHPRLHATDIGFATWAGRFLDAPVPAAQLGGLLENQLAHALMATIEWGTEPLVLRHWRDQRAKQEVDLLLVHADGRCIPIESKSSTVVGPDDTRGIQAFARANPDNFFRGCVAYCGDRIVDLTPDGLPDRSLLAVPIHRLLS